jgi:hypothetical protein
MAYGNNAIYCSDPSKVPKGPHWAIIQGESMYIPGDERSRTNPGHGYPATTKHYVSYKAFLSEEDWNKEVQELAAPKFGSPKPFVAMYVVPATISTKVVVEVKKPDLQQNFGASGGSRC